ncbi:MAG TPA: thiamine pyrophosphate-dependent enzyme, partial [Acidocella sp.]|nr:thiamine pyrophosphate-dependent enzyme [Acidocella sp.]
ETTGIPFLPMSMAKGLLPDNHSQSAAAARSYAIGQADVVMLVGARLNWLLAHGKSPLWSDTTQYVQVDISPTEIDSNRPIAAPVVGDIKSAFAAFLAALKPNQIQPSAEWISEIEQRKQKNIEKMAARLNDDPNPMNFSSALRAVRAALEGKPEVYIVNEGANTLDFARNIIDMYLPRKRLDSGTWGIMGIGMGYAIAAAVESGLPVVAIEGDSAFGFSGMEVETICRYQLPIVTLVFNNSGIYQGDKAGAAPSPTGFVADARYDKLIEAFGGVGYHVTDTPSLQKALTDALAARRPALINVVIDPTAGTESGHIQNLNPKVAIPHK